MKSVFAHMTGQKTTSDSIAAGTYARKQIYCASRLVSWSHRGRFALAAQLAQSAYGGRVLDYGCGDGTFIAMVHENFSGCIGADTDVLQLADCRARFTDLASVEFVPTDALGSEHSARYDVVTCMEVLEHCLAPVRRTVLRELRRLVTPIGRVIISVPIEIGPALVAKQAARRIAAWRNLGDYRHSERYTAGELARMAIVPGRAPIPRAAYVAGDGPTRHEYHGHKGFDWRVLEREVEDLFVISERRFSPMPLLGRWLNSQAWMVCLPR